MLAREYSLGEGGDTEQVVSWGMLERKGNEKRVQSGGGNKSILLTC